MCSPGVESVSGIGKALGSKVRSQHHKINKQKILTLCLGKSRHLPLRSTLSLPAKSRPHLPYFLVKEKQNGQGKPSFPSSFSTVQATHRAGSLPLNLLTVPETFCYDPVRANEKAVTPPHPSSRGESFVLKSVHFGINAHGGRDFGHVLPIPHVTGRRRSLGTSEARRQGSPGRSMTKALTASRLG